MQEIRHCEHSQECEAIHYARSAFFKMQICIHFVNLCSKNAIKSRYGLLRILANARNDELPALFSHKKPARNDEILFKFNPKPQKIYPQARKKSKF